MAHAPLPTAPLGTRGPSVSRIALGTMTFGVETDEAEAHRQLDAFVEAGGTMIDTADVYGAGESERIVGRWLAANPGAEVVVATKGRFAPPPGSAGASRRSLVRSLDASLERIGVDAVDLYLVHGWDPVTPVEETLDVLSSFARQGRIHSIGWSNTTGWQLARIMTTARLGGHVVPTVIQPQYNLLDRNIEHEVLPCALEEGLAVTPWSPLGGGWLTGKYTRDTRPTGATRLGEDPGRGVEAYDTRNTDRTWRVVEAVEQVAQKHGCPMPQVAFAWLLTRRSSPVPARSTSWTRCSARRRSSSTRTTCGCSARSALPASCRIRRGCSRPTAASTCGSSWAPRPGPSLGRGR